MVISSTLARLISYLIIFSEGSGALVIGMGVVRAIFQYVARYLGWRKFDTGSIRIRLGQALVMSLEFLVAADILRTAVAPSWDELLKLGALIILRTVLNYILELELRGLGR
jgi:uncharacterized membrane protein